MKPFNLKDAKKGAKVCTRDGCPVVLLSFNNPNCHYYPIKGWSEDTGFAVWTMDGRWSTDSDADNENDLFMIEDFGAMTAKALEDKLREFRHYHILALLRAEDEKNDEARFRALGGLTLINMIAQQFRLDADLQY